jgi:methylenetetrahydrofolate reductase (NADPH)
MRNLREKLYETSDFLFGVELVSIRGSMAERSAIKARTFAGQLVESPFVDWISITDNAGGNPQLAPLALGKPVLYAGKDVVIHLTCKDLNRNGLESEAWQLDSEGFHNVLAMTGDYPIGGNEGMAKPVFDIDSVALIALLDKMNRGFDDRHQATNFCIGAVTSNYKLLEGEVIPQYLKLEKKVECGAQFIINQVGYDACKAGELRRYMDEHRMAHIPLIGNVYVLNPRVARLFHHGKIPGIVVTGELLAQCEEQGRSADGGIAFFHEFAAKQIAVFRGLGFRGVYLGGAHDLSTIERVLEIERTFAPDDWRGFAREIRYSRPGEFFAYPDEAAADFVTSDRVTPPATSKRSKRVGIVYRLSKLTHRLAFTPDRPLSRWGAKLVQRAKDPYQGPKPLRVLERVSKSLLFRCKDCGDCSLADIAFLCPESQCAKNQRNGPCGGTREGRCEVDGFGDCIWLRAYHRLKHDGVELTLLAHAPVVQNQGLRGTSSWANSWLGRDHVARRATQPGRRPGQAHATPDRGDGNA